MVTSVLIRRIKSVKIAPVNAGNVKCDSWRAVAAYAWLALFVGKGFFSVLLGSIVLSLGAALLTTNNYGGEAVGFRHGVFLAPAFVTLLLPWLVNRGEVRLSFHRATIAVACVSASLLLIFAVRQPWFVLTLEAHPIGTWDQCVPILARILRGELLSP